MTESELTDFGFQTVTRKEKVKRVAKVFDSVAPNYDLMNDLMSFGAHRIWKRYAVHISNAKRGSQVLDVAGGTGDMAVLFRNVVGESGRVVITDINANMLTQGKKVLLDKGHINGMEYVQANAECLPFSDNLFDCISIGFGLRNVTNKDKALESMFAKLKYGGSVTVLEFSKVLLPVLKQLYDGYSFKVIPVIGDLIANDRNSYQYLVESIRAHPEQETLKRMMEDSGFSQVSYFNLSGGIVAVHRGYKL